MCRRDPLAGISPTKRSHKVDPAGPYGGLWSTRDSAGQVERGLWCKPSIGGESSISTNYHSRPQITKSLTRDLVAVFKRCNPRYGYTPNLNPRRILTKPSEGVLNNSYDNADNDYILIVNDIIGTEEGHQCASPPEFRFPFTDHYIFHLDI